MGKDKFPEFRMFEEDFNKFRFLQLLFFHNYSFATLIGSIVNKKSDNDRQTNSIENCKSAITNSVSGGEFNKPEIILLDIQISNASSDSIIPIVGIPCLANEQAKATKN